MKGWPCIAVPQGSAHPINNSEFSKPTPDGGWHLHYVVLQDHLGNLQWPSQDLSSFLHETILSIHVGWVPMIHLHEKMKVAQQSDFFSMSCLKTGRREYSFTLGYDKIILHRIISVVWLTNFLSEIRSLSNHDDETKFHILSVKPFRRFSSSEHWWSLVLSFTHNNGCETVWVA